MMLVKASSSCYRKDKFRQLSQESCIKHGSESLQFSCNSSVRFLHAHPQSSTAVIVDGFVSTKVCSISRDCNKTHENTGAVTRYFIQNHPNYPLLVW